MSMAASVLIARVSQILNDMAQVSWTQDQIIDWINEALANLAVVRPDSTIVTTTQALTANSTRQTLTGATDMRLLRLTRNMGAAGLTPGRVIYLTSIENLNASNPNWHTDSASTAVREYAFLPEDPKAFWVHPQPSTAFFVELQKSTLVSIAADTDSMPVDDIFSGALLEWVLFRALDRNVPDAAQAAAAAEHFRAFFNLLQVKMQADMGADPRVRRIIDMSVIRQAGPA